MRQATDEEIKAAFDEHLKASNLPRHIKNGDYRSGWVRQAWASFYSGWRRCENCMMDNVVVHGQDEAQLRTVPLERPVGREEE